MACKNRVGNTRYLDCVCDCGVSKCVRVDSLVNGSSVSCGCYANEQISKRASTRNGISKHRLYTIWHDAQRRCYNKIRKDYKHYGGRGIKMCDRWNDHAEGFTNFIEDMGSTWSEGLELERVNCNGDYEPSNCCWVTRKQQTNNLRYNRKLTYKGLTLTCSEWASLLNIKRTTLYDRSSKLKWSDEKTITYPSSKISGYVKAGNFYKNLKSLLEGAFSIKPDNTTVYFKKFKGGKEGFLKLHGIEVINSERREVTDVVSYLINKEVKPEWETDDLLYIKNKYEYYYHEERKV